MCPVPTSNFALTDTHLQFRDTMRQFCDERIAPRAAEVDRLGQFPWDSFKDCCELELPSLGIPEAYGGLGLNMEEEVQLVFELG